MYDALTAMNRSQTSRYQEEEVGWLSCGDKYIKKLTDGNERIIAVEIQTKNKPISLINVWHRLRIRRIRIRILGSTSTTGGSCD